MGFKTHISLASFLTPQLLLGSFSSLEDEYTPTYCVELEHAYGTGMMSEGGVNGIEYMFDQISLEKRKALDIGSGLGGVAFHLAKKYGMQVTGLEVNPWMVEESRRRRPSSLDSHVDFVLSKGNSGWEFSEQSFDLIYSKGVFTHLESKDEILQECRRHLKKEGQLVITDWLSSDQRQWGPNIARLVELEKLVLFPESESSYVSFLKKNGYTIRSVRDDSAVYLQYNREIIENLRMKHLDGERNLQDSIDGYESIAKAIEVGELRVLRFVAGLSL